MAWKNMLNEANILVTAEFVCQLEHEQIHVNLQLGTTEQSLFIAAYKTHEGRSLAVCVAYVFLACILSSCLSWLQVLLLDLKQTLDQGTSPDQAGFFGCASDEE